MKDKPKATSGGRVRTGWFMEPPFKDQSSSEFFHRQNWWGEVGKGLVPREALIYEFVRRHSEIGALLLARTKPSGALDSFLNKNALTAWPWLPPEARETFARFCRVSLVANLTSTAQKASEPIRFQGKTLAATRRKYLESYEREADTVGRLARAEALDGKLVLSLPPDADPQAIADEAARTLAAWQEKKSLTPQPSRVETRRDRTKSWLNIISRFEWSEEKRYWQFPEEHLLPWDRDRANWPEAEREAKQREREKAFTVLKGQGKLRTVRRSQPLSRSANQKERRAFERVCNKFFMSLKRPLR